MDKEFVNRTETLTVNNKLTTVLSAGIYNAESLTAKVIKKVKYKHNRDLIRPLIKQLYWLLYGAPELINKHTIITFTPSHWYRTNWRGFNQAQELANGLAKKTGIPSLNMFRRIKNNGSQVGRSGRRRRTMLINAFAINIPPPPKTKLIIFVDDVLTTGSTMRELLRTWMDSKYYSPKINLLVLCLKSRLVF